jgi:hypothetical protein
MISLARPHGIGGACPTVRETLGEQRERSR